LEARLKAAGGDDGSRRHYLLVADDEAEYSRCVPLRSPPCSPAHSQLVPPHSRRTNLTVPAISLSLPPPHGRWWDALSRRCRVRTFAAGEMSSWLTLRYGPFRLSISASAFCISASA
jgi:hypothetical protein